MQGEDIRMSAIIVRGISILLIHLFSEGPGPANKLLQNISVNFFFWYKFVGLNQAVVKRKEVAQLQVGADTMISVPSFGAKRST